MGIRNREQDDDEHSRHSFRQISDQPLGFMETGHPYGIRVQRLVSGPGFVARSGSPCVDRELSGREMERVSPTASGT
jgi:hypothetical protein